MDGSPHCLRGELIMLRTRVARFITAVIVMGTALLLGIGPSTADVFHGYWIYGKIHEEYDQAGQANGFANGYAFFGNATTPESNT
jgi:hypothetical protein